MKPFANKDTHGQAALSPPRNECGATHHREAQNGSVGNQTKGRELNLAGDQSEYIYISDIDVHKHRETQKDTHSDGMLGQVFCSKRRRNWSISFVSISQSV